jgi:hypothetical protein
MQLKNATISSKGGDKAKQMVQKELEKSMKRLSEMEMKYKNAAADKGQVRCRSSPACPGPAGHQSDASVVCALYALKRA